MTSEAPVLQRTRGEWTSERGFIFSMAAAAVGLGNLWRFPYMVGENGGGAFILAYLLALVIVVLPMMMTEVAAGRLAQGSTVQTYRHVHRIGVVYGWFVVTLTLFITSYYVVITGWTLGYAVDASRVAVRPFDEYSAGYNSLWYFLAVVALVGLLLVWGLKALEHFSRLVVPLLLMVMVVLTVAASRTDGWEEAGAFLLETDFSRLGDGRLWVMAFGQAFYSVAIGQGYLVTYGSYIPKGTHLPRACIVIAIFETCVALLAGWMLFPFVFSYGGDPGEGSQLAFSTLPQVFDDMAGGALLAIGFFVLFFLAAFSSSVAGTKVVVAAVSEEFRISHVRAVAIVTVVVLTLGLPSALSFTPIELRVSGEPFLEWLDQLLGTWVIIFSGVAGVAFFCWLVPPMKMRRVLGTKARWWEWRMYVIGRWLPFAIIIALAVGWFVGRS